MKNIDFFSFVCSEKFKSNTISFLRGFHTYRSCRTGMGIFRKM